MYSRFHMLILEKTCFTILAALLLLLHFPLTCMAMRAANITTDQSALLALKAHISFHTDHILVKNWTTTSSISVCNWIGVTCSTCHQRVAALDLPDMGLRGTIPPHLGNLSFLVRLNIGNNSFHGELPKELAHLHRLQLFNVRLNNFGGQVPSWFGAFTELKYLNLRNNSFTGPIPPSLSNCSKLEFLYLYSNLLTGKIPQEMSNLYNLKSLDMQFNQLTGLIPPSIFNISSLELIALTSNGLSGSLPVDICYGLPKLKFLHLSVNKLEGQIPSNLQECSKLQRLALAYNKFSGTIPREIANLTVLEALYLDGNDLNGEIPHELANLVNLEVLGLEDNGFTGGIPRNMCSHLPLLQVLYLRRNKLTGSIPSDIGNCTSIKEIDLYENNLTGVIPEQIGRLWKLEVLALNSNNLRGPIPATVFNISALKIISISDNLLSGNLPPTMGLGSPNLEKIYLVHNGLVGMIPDTISNASKLSILDFSHNKFSGSIPHSLGNLGLLEKLGLHTNKFISGKSSSPELGFITSLTNCRHLRKLWIHYNPLNGILPSSIGNLSNYLESFKATDCGIMGYIPKEIGNLSNLAVLALNDNHLIGTPPITVKGLQKLQVLTIGNNSLRGAIPTDLCHLQKLGLLDLTVNEFFGSVPACLGNITSLRYLYLGFNKLTSTIPASLWSLKDLLEFNMSSNSITGYIPPDIRNLKVAILIDLSMNQLSREIPSTIGGLQSLIHLSLAHNRFQGPIPNSFGNLISLEFLDLSHNNLSGVIPNSLEALSYLKYFNISFNRLRGEIPSGGPFQNFTSLSFISNEGLCGAPRLQVLPCHDGSLKHSKTKRSVLLFAYVFLGVALIILIFTSTFVMLRCKRKNQFSTPIDVLRAVTHERITYQELLQATNTFDESNLLGTGSFSLVYKGVLTDGEIVAIKVFNLELEGSFKSFDTECEMLRNIRHRNLTKVISSCSNLDFKALVLEYMPNGSLEKWLYSHNYFLDIQQRVDIMIDVACALYYLHHGYTIPVVHCDLKPSNVLLDDDMVAHVSDFGIAKFLRDGDSIAQTNTLATIGYIAPEYGLEGLVSTRGDVYSFGIMLMEVFTRKKPTEEMFALDLSLKHWINESLPNCVIQVIDANLLMQDEENFTAKVHCVSSILELALNCTAESPEERINMGDALISLKKIRHQFLANLERFEN